jgi:hypothetical protein
MRKIAVVFGLLGVAWSVTGANADDCPSGQRYRMSGACADASGHKIHSGTNETKLAPGYVLFPNAQGQNVPIKHATTYAQCARNGHSLGYGDAQIQTYCHEHYAH